MHAVRRVGRSTVTFNNDANATILASNDKIAHSDKRFLTGGARTVDTTESNNAIADL